jgi:hypothetical protein
MDEIISYKTCAVKVRNAKLLNYLNYHNVIGQVIVFDFLVVVTLLLYRVEPL